MEAGVATDLSQPRLFSPGFQQPQPPGSLCTFKGKVTLADLPVGIDADILNHSDELQLVREARLFRQSKKKK